MPSFIFYLRIFLIIFIGGSFISCNTEKTVTKSTKDKTFLFGIGTEPQTLDPQRATSVSEALVLQSAFLGLCAPDNEDDTRSLDGVAKRWESNDSASQWTFQLKKSAQWSDKTPLTACDFIFSYHRILHPAGGAKYADMLYIIKNAEAYNKDWRGYLLCGPDSQFPLSWDKIASINWNGQDLHSSDQLLQKKYMKKGLNKLTLEELQTIQNDLDTYFTWPTSLTSEEKTLILQALINHAKAGFPDLWEKAHIGVEAPDEHTLRFTLRAPTPFFPLLTRHFSWYPVPAHVVAQAQDSLGLYNTEWTKPGQMVSNGPFVIKEWRINDYILAEKNPHYFKNTPASIKSIKFFPIVNGFTETRMFLNGKLHATNNIPPEMLSYAKEKSPKEFKMTDYYSTSFLRFNTNHSVLRDKRIRQALSLTLNRQELIRTVLQGAASPCTGFTPPTQSYTPPNIVKYDPDTARKLFKEAGFSQKNQFPKLSILITSREVQKTMAEAIQAQWKKELGIDVEIRSSEWAGYKLAQQQGDYDIVYGNWSGDYADCSTFLELWTSSNGNNNTGWSSPLYNELIQRAQNETNPDKRSQLYFQAESLVLKESPIAPLTWNKRCYFISQQLKGWTPLHLDNRSYTNLNLSLLPHD